MQKKCNKLTEKKERNYYMSITKKSLVICFNCMKDNLG